VTLVELLSSEVEFRVRATKLEGEGSKFRVTYGCSE